MFHTVVCDLLGIRYPVLQGAMQGGGGVELVAAVSEAGGLGVLPTFGGTNQKLRADIAAVRARTKKPNIRLLLLLLCVARWPRCSNYWRR